MSDLSYKTPSVNKESIKPTWVEINGTGQIVGRLATQIANLLRGKHRPWYTPHLDCGDYVIVTNADKVKFTGKKEEKKRYISYTGYPGGQRETSPVRLRAKGKSLFILRMAVKRMLQKNKLARQQIKKLHLYASDQHPHQAQNPQKIKINQ